MKHDVDFKWPPCKLSTIHRFCLTLHRSNIECWWGRKQREGWELGTGGVEGQQTLAKYSFLTFEKRQRWPMLNINDSTPPCPVKALYAVTWPERCVVVMPCAVHAMVHTPSGALMMMIKHKSTVEFMIYDNDTWLHCCELGWCTYKWSIYVLKEYNYYMYKSSRKACKYVFLPCTVVNMYLCIYHWLSDIFKTIFFSEWE